MELVGSRSRYRVENTSRRISILSGKCIGQKRELINCINTQRGTQNAAGRVVALIVHTDAIEEKIIRGGTLTRDSKRFATARAH